MTHAIVEANGTQLWVEPGRFYDVNRLPVNEDETITLDKVFYVAHDGEATVGQPLIEGAVVSATVMRHLRGRKVIVYKMQPKKKTRKKRGHRQELTRIMIDAICMNDEVIAGELASSPGPGIVPESAAETTSAESAIAVDDIGVAPSEAVPEVEIEAASSEPAAVAEPVAEAEIATVEVSAEPPTVEAEPVTETLEETVEEQLATETTEETAETEPVAEEVEVSTAESAAEETEVASDASEQDLEDDTTETPVEAVASEDE